MSENKSEIVAVLAAVQAAVKAPKNQINKFSNYSYRSLEDILEAAKPITSKLNAAIVISDDVVQIGPRFYVKATASFLYGDDAISTTAFAREPEEKKGNDAMQITGTASSYARKYAVSSLLCLDDTKDIDSEDNRLQGITPKPAAKPATAPAGGPQRPAEPKPAQTAAEMPEAVSAALAHVLESGPHKGKTLKEIYKANRDDIVTIHGDAAFKGDNATVEAINTIDNYLATLKK